MQAEAFVFGIFRDQDRDQEPIERYRLEVYSGRGPAVPYEVCPDGFHCRAKLELASGETIYFFDEHQQIRGEILGLPEDNSSSGILFLPTSLLPWVEGLASRGQLRLGDLRARKALVRQE